MNLGLQMRVALDHGVESLLRTRGGDPDHLCVDDDHTGVFPAIAMDVSRTTSVVCGVIAALLIVFSVAWALRLTFIRPRPKDRPGRSENGS